MDSEQNGTLSVKGSNNSTPVTLTINQAAGMTNLARAGGAKGEGGGEGAGGA